MLAADVKLTLACIYQRASTGVLLCLVCQIADKHLFHTSHGTTMYSRSILSTGRIV